MNCYFYVVEITESETTVKESGVFESSKNHPGEILTDLASNISVNNPTADRILVVEFYNVE